MSGSSVVPAPLVSVAITAFNSEKWLSRALDSVLLQRTVFPIEIFIADDCSTDGTIAIARAYRERHPQTIRVIERTRNVGMQRNYYETFEQCRGKYIAWLDADDYWTDPEKLAVQAQVLESDTAVNVCSHFIRQVTTEGDVKKGRFPSLAPGRYGLHEIIRNNFVPSPSIMFRNGIHHKLPEWYFDLAGLVDWPILILAALSGDIVLLDRVMADYMLTTGSAYMSKGSIYQNTLDLQFLDRIESILPPECRRSIRSAKGKKYESISYALSRQGDFAASRKAALKALRFPELLDNRVSKIKTLLAAVAFEAKSRLQRSSAI